MTAILYQNASQTVTLIDIPKSISLAQGTHEDPSTRESYSSTPPREAYASTEPKSERAKANVLRAKGGSDGDGGAFRELLLQALDEIRQSWTHDWCLKRNTATSVLHRHDGSRRAGESLHETPSIGPGKATVPPWQDPQLRTLEDEHETWKALTSLLLPLERSSHIDMCDVKRRLVQNRDSSAYMLQLLPIRSKYYIPASASFILTNINPSTANSLAMAALNLHPNHSTTTLAGPGQFDFILLDPPWENRSVRRARQYDSMRGDDSPMETLGWLLSQHIAPNGLVGMWITNKASVRELALDAFRNWEVDVVEEWIWLKVTVNGEPVTEIGGVWRKPYEVLLIGRRNAKGAANEPVSYGKTDVKRRLIVAVPGLHSQKPNLKELMAPLTKDYGENYRALEIFARNLTAGWCSWGDEVLRYNWEGYWIDKRF